MGIYYTILYRAYVSTFVDFLILWINILHGKKSVFSQVYHNTGGVFVMWLLYVTFAPPTVMVVLLTSFVTMLVYGYGTMAAFGFRLRELEQYCFHLQSLHLLVCLLITLPSHFLYSSECYNLNSSHNSSYNGSGECLSECLSPAASVALLVYQIYAAIQIFLLVQRRKKVKSRIDSKVQ